MIISSEQVLFADFTCGPGEIEISGDTVTAVRKITEHATKSPAAEQVSGMVAPGFVDTHVHGGGGGDFATTDRALAVRARDFHLRHGSTTMIASLVTDELDVIVDQLAMLRQLCADGLIAGIHLEGPFLSAGRCGAHPPALLRDPDQESAQRLITAGGDDLTMITIAPELPGAIEAIEQFVAAGVVVAVGHTSGTDDDVRRALDAGATVGTHLFNAMNPIHHREPGPIPVLLTDPRAHVELIADGTHLDPAVLAMAIEAAGPARVALITDAMVAAGLADGRYGLGTLAVEVANQVARLVADDGSVGSIAGSTLTMAKAVEFVTSVVGRDLVDVVRMATATPAGRFNLPAGVLATGRRADLVVLDKTGRLIKVMAGGQWLEDQDQQPSQSESDQ